MTLKKTGALAVLALVSSVAQAQYTETLLETSKAWGSAIADYNGDGHDDIFITGHDINDRIWFWTPSGYVPSSQVLSHSDRHDCDAADFNQDGRMDFYCAVGADKGLGVGVNELWLQQPDGLFTAMVGHGAEDPYGSGRLPIFFDLNKDGFPDLFLSNSPRLRSDGELSTNRVFLNRQGLAFVEVTTIAKGLKGWGCVAKADINGDGWDDLLLCNHDGAGYIYLNNHQDDFTELDSPAISQWKDAKLADLNQDGLPDLVVLNWKNQLQIWLNTGKGLYYESAAFTFDLAPAKAMALAVGDFNADGHRDVYVVLKQEGCVDNGVTQDTAADVVFLGQKKGTTWKQTKLKQHYAGCGQGADVVDGNKVLVLNGGDQYSGPNYLLAPRGTGGQREPRSAAR